MLGAVKDHRVSRPRSLWMHFSGFGLDLEKEHVLLIVEEITDAILR